MSLKSETVRRLGSVGAVAWMALIFFLSSQEKLPTTAGMPPDIAAIAGHFVAYSVLAIFIRVAIGGLQPGRRADVIAIALATLYGISDEFHQSFVPGRDSSVFDVAIDLLGASAGAIALNLILAVTQIRQDEQ